MIVTGNAGSKPFCEKGELHGGVRALDHIAHPGHAEGCLAAGSAPARGCQPCYNGGSRNEPDGVKPGGEIRVRESAGLKLVALVPVGFFIFWRDGKGSVESSCSFVSVVRRSANSNP